jgi:hypothetical protein
MAYSYALLELNEALRAIKQEAATDPQIIHLNDALYAASEEIQNDLGRNVVKLSTKHWIEYHERSHSEPTVLRVLHWPIQADWGSLEIAEDSSRAYGATTVLTSGTDYRIVNEGDHTSKIERISGDSETTWLSGYEAIRITFKGGWALADIPPPIKRVCRKYTALLSNIETLGPQLAFGLPKRTIPDGERTNDPSIRRSHQHDCEGPQQGYPAAVSQEPKDHAAGALRRVLVKPFRGADLEVATGEIQPQRWPLCEIRSTEPPLLCAMVSK